MSFKPLYDLGQIVCELEILSRLGDGNVPLDPSKLRALAGNLRITYNSLAARLAPAKVVIALNDTAPGLDQASAHVVASTVSVTLVVIDHQTQARERLFIVSEAEVADPRELIEVASDEAAVYLQQDARLIESLTKHC